MDETSIEIVTAPTKVWKLDFNTKRIVGYTNEKDALLQSIKLILGCERYKYAIHDDNYGVEFHGSRVHDLSKLAPEIFQSEAEMIITDALMQDDRITSVTNFIFNIDSENKEKMFVSAVVHSIYGDIQANEPLSI